MNSDNLCNGLSSDAERIISLTKSGCQREVGINLTKPLVIDDEECVDMLRHLLNTVEGLVYLLGPFEAEGNRHDANGQYAHLFGDTRNDRCCTSAGSSTHTGCNKRHPGTVAEHGLDVFNTLLSSLTGTLGLITGTKSLGAQLQMDWHRRVV